MKVLGYFDKDWVINILTFYYQLQFFCLHKHLYIINRYSWLISNALNVTFFLPLLNNVVDITDWCINQLVKFVLVMVNKFFYPIDCYTRTFGCSDNLQSHFKVQYLEQKNSTLNKRLDDNV